MLESLAEKAAAKTKPVRYVNGVPTQEVFVDPATISICISAITAVVKAIKYCRDKRAESEDESIEAAARIVNQPTFREKNALRRMLRREMGWRKFFADGGKTMKALLETGQDLTKEEVAEVWSEV